jgi:hypothetical protein
LSSACVLGCSDQKIPPFPIRLQKHYSVEESAFWPISSIVHFEVGDSETSKSNNRIIRSNCTARILFYFVKKHILIYNSQFMIHLQENTRFLYIPTELRTYKYGHTIFTESVARIYLVLKRTRETLCDRDSNPRKN